VDQPALPQGNRKGQQMNIKQETYGEPFDRSFTFEQALDLQARDLRRWAWILQPSVAVELYAEASAQNLRLVKKDGSPFDVWRGQDIEAWIANRSYAGGGQ